MKEIIRNGILYTVKNDDTKEVRVGNNSDIYLNGIKGKIDPVLRFPSHVFDNGVSYEVTSVGKNAFYSCTSLTAVVFPNTIKTLEHGCFSDCLNMSTIEFLPGSKLEVIDGQVFCRSYRVKAVILPESLKSIQFWAFFLMNDLKLIVYAGKRMFNEDVFGLNEHRYDDVQSKNVTILVRKDYRYNTFGLRNVTRSSDVKPQMKQTCRVMRRSFNNLISVSILLMCY